MFYCQEILTSREAGIATIWLVATLGSSTKHRKITRKSILEVDVPKACGIITRPEAPMALRLQSNLLYGVTRVLSRQYEYVLSDAQLVQSHIRALLKVVRTSALDMNAGKAAPEQLVIPVDLSFMPDAAVPGLDIDLYALGISSDDSTRRSSILSPRSLQSSASSQQDDGSALGLIIPSSDSGAGGPSGGFQLQSEGVSSAAKHLQEANHLDNEDVIFNPGFSMDEDGNLVEFDQPIRSTESGQEQDIRLGSEADASAIVRRDLMEGLRLGQREALARPEDIYAPIPDNDDYHLPEAEPFPNLEQREGPRPPQQSSPSGDEREPEQQDAAQAALGRRPRTKKPLARDEVLEMSTSGLYGNHLNKMQDAKALKRRKAATLEAKRNANNWAMSFGMGGVGVALGRAKLRSPLSAVFSGLPAVDFFRGAGQNESRQKRSRDRDDEAESDRLSKRVRADQGEAEEVGRGVSPLMQDDDILMLPDSGDIEVGRHAQPSLEDPSFPWNTTSAPGSRYGSVSRGRAHPTSLGGFPSSIGAPGSLHGMGSHRPSSIDRRTSRITGASPLVGRGALRFSSVSAPGPEGAEFSEGMFDYPEQDPDPQALADFELYGPAAAVDTQTAAESQWIRAALTREAGNFLSFVKNEIDTRASAAQHVDAEAEDNGNILSEPAVPSVSFDALLPPAQHSKIVGAQALLHVLALATAGQLNVVQAEAFGTIKLSVPDSTTNSE